MDALLVQTMSTHVITVKISITSHSDRKQDFFTASKTCKEEKIRAKYESLFYAGLIKEDHKTATYEGVKEVVPKLFNNWETELQKNIMDEDRGE